MDHMTERSVGFEGLDEIEPGRTWFERLLARFGPPVYVLVGADSFRFRCQAREAQVSTALYVAVGAPQVLSVGAPPVNGEFGRRVELFSPAFRSESKETRSEWWAAFFHRGIREVSPRRALIRPVIVCAGIEDLLPLIGVDAKEVVIDALVAAGARKVMLANPEQRRPGNLAVGL